MFRPDIGGKCRARAQLGLGAPQVVGDAGQEMCVCRRHACCWRDFLLGPEREGCILCISTYSARSGEEPCPSPRRRHKWARGASLFHCLFSVMKARRRILRCWLLFFCFVGPPTVECRKGRGRRSHRCSLSREGKKRNPSSAGKRKCPRSVKTNTYLDTGSGWRGFHPPLGGEKLRAAGWLEQAKARKDRPYIHGQRDERKPELPYARLLWSRSCAFTFPGRRDDDDDDRSVQCQLQVVFCPMTTAKLGLSRAV